MCNELALVVVPSDNQYRLIVHILHLRKWRMTLHEHADVQFHSQFLRQVRNPFRLILSAAVGEEDEWNAFALEVRQRLVRARESIGGTDEYTINTFKLSACTMYGSRDVTLLECKRKVRRLALVARSE